jgi:hypothetical protein
MSGGEVSAPIQHGRPWREPTENALHVLRARSRKRLSRAEAELGGFLIASAVHVKPEHAHS